MRKAPLQKKRTTFILLAECIARGNIVKRWGKKLVNFGNTNKIT